MSDCWCSWKAACLPACLRAPSEQRAEHRQRQAIQDYNPVTLWQSYFLSLSKLPRDIWAFACLGYLTELPEGAFLFTSIN